MDIAVDTISDVSPAMACSLHSSIYPYVYGFYLLM
jgi:hypothetical protein